MTECERKIIEDNLNVVAMATWRFMKRYNVPASEFEDYRQTGYLILCNKVHKYDGSTKFSTFIDIVLRNAFIDIYRTNKRGQIDETSLDEYLSEEKSFSESELDEILKDVNTTENQVIERVTGDIIAKCIKKAKKTCKSKTIVRGFEALELRIEGYTSAQIAKLLEAPSNTIRVGINRAKNILLSDEDFINAIKTI